MSKKTGGKILVETLRNHKVKHVFTVPGAKIDKILDEFYEVENAPKLIVCRHEQNAALIAQGIGRLTGEPGVVLVTSGPGVSNLATGLITATSESDPVIAIGGQVKRSNSLKRTHQSMDNVGMMSPATKWSKEILSADAISEAFSNAYRESISSRQGAVFLSIPQDVTFEKTEYNSLHPVEFVKMGSASEEKIKNLVEKIKKAKLPVLLLGMRSSTVEVVTSIRNLLKNVELPVVETFQGAGIIPKDLEKTFFGRVGLFKNQPGDILLDNSDLVISIGFDPIEYDPEVWNKTIEKEIFHLDEVQADIDNYYKPKMELIGDISKTIDKMTIELSNSKYELTEKNWKFLNDLKNKFENITKLFKYNPNLTHPLQLMWEVRQLMNDENFKEVDDETIVTVDVGSIYIWMARNFKSYEPRKLLFSNGMQTLGVALPWAIAGSLINPDKKVISMSGDGGFLFSGQELDTAVRENCNITHIIWNDKKYNMVDFQQIMKYGRPAATELGDIDFVKYAESFGAKGLRVESPDELVSKLKEALSYKGVCVLEVPIDYENNIILGKMLLEDFN